MSVFVDWHLHFNKGDEMKEIKAYIRPSMADRVISALEIAGVPGIDNNRCLYSRQMG